MKVSFLFGEQKTHFPQISLLVKN